MRVADFEFDLPEELIAQHPSPVRGASRLLTLHRSEDRIAHGTFSDLLHTLRAGDVLVLNNSKVIAARLHAINLKTGGAFAILLLEENLRNDWWTMMRPAKRARVGAELVVLDLQSKRSAISATVIETNDEGHRRLQFTQHAADILPTNFNIADVLDELGEIPLPPYIKRDAKERSDEDRMRYQTVYAREKSSVAAPTAGLHFTDEMLSRITARGIEVCFVTLHVGLGTFAPVKADKLEEHKMHFERFHVDEITARKITTAKQQGRRIIAVGTTTVRLLETLALENDGRIVSGGGRTNIFIHPPFTFRIVDALITNFHLARSTLLMLVSAFATPGEITGRDKILAAYAEAVKQRYRFFSYGDAMMIL